MTEKERCRRYELHLIRRALLRVIDDPQTPPAVILRALERIDEIDSELEADA
jgi:hypothetical protein